MHVRRHVLHNSDTITVQALGTLECLCGIPLATDAFSANLMSASDQYKW